MKRTLIALALISMLGATPAVQAQPRPADMQALGVHTPASRPADAPKPSPHAYAPVPPSPPTSSNLTTLQDTIERLRTVAARQADIMDRQQADLSQLKQALITLEQSTAHLNTRLEALETRSAPSGTH